MAVTKNDGIKHKMGIKALVGISVVAGVAMSCLFVWEARRADDRE